MKTKLLTIITTTLLSLTGFNQTLIPFKGENGKFGYKDDIGNTIIEPIYAEVEEFGNNEYALTNEGIIDKKGEIVLTKDKIAEVNNLNKSFTLETYANNNLFWVNCSNGWNDNGQYCKIDVTGKIVSELKNGRLFTIGFLNANSFYDDENRLLVNTYSFDPSSASIDVSYQIISRNGEEISEKYSYINYTCDGYVVSNANWNCYDEKTSIKMSKKYSNMAKYNKIIHFFYLNGTCTKVDQNFKPIEEIENFFDDNENETAIIIGRKDINSDINSSRTVSLTISSRRCD